MKKTFCDKCGAESAQDTHRLYTERYDVQITVKGRGHLGQPLPALDLCPQCMANIVMKVLHE